MSNMGNTYRSLLDRLRQPAYTGPNRCSRCTAVNTVLAVAVASALATISLPVGAFAFLVSIAMIYFRGYLIPGTPTLTKRYFPDSLLALFGKAGVDGVSVLTELDVVEEKPGENDLSLTDTVRDEFQSEFDSLTDTTEKERLRNVFQVDSIEIDEAPGACIVLGDGEPLLRRESRLALQVELAALPILERRADNFLAEDVSEQFAILASFRSFVEHCPACETPISVTQESVESCCSTATVTVLGCGECQTDILEVAS